MQITNQEKYEKSLDIYLFEIIFSLLCLCCTQNDNGVQPNLTARWICPGLLGWEVEKKSSTRAVFLPPPSSPYPSVNNNNNTCLLLGLAPAKTPATWSWRGLGWPVARFLLVRLHHRTHNARARSIKQNAARKSNIMAAILIHTRRWRRW